MHLPVCGEGGVLYASICDALQIFAGLFGSSGWFSPGVCNLRCVHLWQVYYVSQKTLHRMCYSAVAYEADTRDTSAGSSPFPVTLLRSNALPLLLAEVPAPCGCLPDRV